MYENETYEDLWYGIKRLDENMEFRETGFLKSVNEEKCKIVALEQSKHGGIYGVFQEDQELPLFLFLDGRQYHWEQV